jgi:hypothetical protein
MDCLDAQTLRPDMFELIIVDGLHRHRADEVADLARSRRYRVVHVPPRDTLWTRNRKVAICTFRNTGIAVARGELVVNLDDIVHLPDRYLSGFARAWTYHGTCLAATWRDNGDVRLRMGEVARDALPGEVYGFGSYPVDLAVRLGGYDEAFDGAQGLEDGAWSHRLYRAGLPSKLVWVDGFRLHPQNGHDARAIDSEEPVVKCCNAAWQVEVRERNVLVANHPDLWSGVDGHVALERLVGPCRFFMPADNRCMHHNLECAFLKKRWPFERHPLAQQFISEPPIVDLLEERKKNGVTP